MPHPCEVCEGAVLDFCTSQLERISVSAGNMTKDGSGLTYTFDAENRLTLGSGMSGGPYCYVYDGNGLRVAKKSSASSCSSGTVAKVYWRSLSGNTAGGPDDKCEADSGCSSLVVRGWVLGFPFPSEEPRM